MFDWLRNITKTDITENDIDNILIHKHINQAQIGYLPYETRFYSNNIIDYNNKKYVIGICVLCKHFNLYITEINIVPRNRIIYISSLYDGTEKCKFLLEKLPEVELSLREISEQLNNKMTDKLNKKDCEQKCMIKLMKKIK
jgi:hypothetical protein